MLKFAGRWDIDSKRWVDKRHLRTLYGNDNERRYGEYLWPTVDELDEFNAAGAADTILQILHGQGIYRGYDVDSYADNFVAPRAGIETWDAPVDTRRDADRRTARRKEIEYIERRKARTFYRKHWRTIEKNFKTPRLQYNLTLQQRLFVRTCVANGNFTRESAIELALQLIPGVKK